MYLTREIRFGHNRFLHHYRPHLPPHTAVGPDEIDLKERIEKWDLTRWGLALHVVISSEVCLSKIETSSLDLAQRCTTNFLLVLMEHLEDVGFG